MRKEPKIGTKAPAKMGGTGGGLSKASVGAAIAAKPMVKKVAERKLIRQAVDTKRNAKAMDEMK